MDFLSGLFSVSFLSFYSVVLYAREFSYSRVIAQLFQENRASNL